MSDPRKILITGGSGFIGSWLIRRLLNDYPDCHITNLDKLTYAGNPDNLADVEQHPQYRARYRFVRGDIRDAETVNALMREADVCINAAAQTHVDRSIDGPGVFIDTNVGGTQVLLEAARHAGVERFIQISTDEVYGSVEAPARSDETAPLNPSSPYAASKAAADLIVLSYWKTYGLPVCITRCTNNYGPNQYPEKLVPLFILNAMEDRFLPVYGDGLNVRDWIHVADHAAGVSAVLRGGRPGEVYHIGADNTRNNLEITGLILEILDKPETLKRFVTDRLGHDRRYALNCGKIERELGWKAVTPFSEGLRETVRWYRENPQWIANVRRRGQELAEAPPAIASTSSS